MSLWISVNDRLPKKGQMVLVYRPEAAETDDPLIRTAIYGGQKKYGFSHGFSCLCTPTPWQPLPPPPEE